MKSKAILIFCVLFVVAACKKVSNDECGTNKHLEYGACVCDTDWFGWNCDKPSSICGPHAHGVEDWCVCDSGWLGSDCSFSIEDHVGTYHVVGVSSTVIGGTFYTPVYIDEDMIVSIRKDTLIARGYKHLYAPNYGDTNRYSFPSPFVISRNNYSVLSFHKTLDDSVFYTSRSGGLGGGTTTTLRGKRVL